MPGPVIAAYLSTDTVDTTAALVRAANPSMHWTSDNQVPVYLYQSLATILGVAPSDLPRRIVAIAGTNESVADAFIQICPVYDESAGHPDGFQFDFSGGEYAVVNILFSKGRPVPAANNKTLINAELRVRMLLDYTIRDLCAGKGPSLPSVATAADNSIVSTEEYGYFVCKWGSLLKEPNASEMVSKYKVNYIRQFGLSIINIP